MLLVITQFDLFLSIVYNNLVCAIIAHTKLMYCLLKLQPLRYGVLAELFHDRTPAERVAIYAISGGKLAYWELFTRARRVSEVLREHCLPSGSVMLEAALYR